MKKINIDDIPVWMIGKKTRNIKAKPLISIMVDKNVLSKFLLDTIEGREPLGDGSIICLGESNDVWQQSQNKLLQKYSVIEIDKDGWMVCEPRPDNSVECIEVTKDYISDYDPLWDGSQANPFYIIGHWGEQTPEGMIQKGVMGDFICRSRTDSTDVWVVARKIFINTYNIIG